MEFILPEHFLFCHNGHINKLCFSRPYDYYSSPHAASTLSEAHVNVLLYLSIEWCPRPWYLWKRRDTECRSGGKTETVHK